MAAVSSSIKAHIVTNIETTQILITEDKARVILSNHFSKISKNKDWINALALFVTLVVSLFTADFKGFLGFSPDTVTALFVLLSVVSFVYLCLMVYRSIKNRDSVENIINDLKGCKDD